MKKNFIITSARLELRRSKAVLAFAASGVESVALHTDSIDSNFDNSILKITFVLTATRLLTENTNSRTRDDESGPMSFMEHKF